MRRLIYLVIVINFLLLCMPGKSYCHADDSKLEVDWEHLTPTATDRNLDTVSLHILEKISETKNRSVYRGITIIWPSGDIILNQQTRDSSATGIGPIYMIRDEEYHSGKLAVALEMSGGLIVYNKIFPDGGRNHNFMWRIGPKVTYKVNENSTVNVGYMLMHVSNGFKTHNPSYNARGVSLGLVTNF